MHCFSSNCWQAFQILSKFIFTILVSSLWTAFSFMFFNFGSSNISLESVEEDDEVEQFILWWNLLKKSWSIVFKKLAMYWSLSSFIITDPYMQSAAFSITKSSISRIISSLKRILRSWSVPWNVCFFLKKVLMNLGFDHVIVNLLHLLVAYCGFTLLWISNTLSITVFQEARNLSETRMKFSDSLPLSDLNLELVTSRIHLQSSFTLFFSSKSFWNVCPTKKRQKMILFEKKNSPKMP